MRRPFEEKRDRHLKYLGDLLKSAGADAVGSLFVFLDLLKCETEGIAELLLTHAQHHPTHAHARTDVLVDRIRCLLGHRILLCPH